jgi:DNA-binding transcriptional MerR regulator
MKKEFLVRDVSEITGLKPREVVDLVDRGIIEPLKEARGSGTRRVFSFRNIVQISIYKLLRVLGLSRPRIRDCLERIDQLEGIENYYHPHRNPFYDLVMALEEGELRFSLEVKKNMIEEALKMRSEASQAGSQRPAMLQELVYPASEGKAPQFSLRIGLGQIKERVDE